MKKLTLLLVVSLVCCLALAASAHFASGTKICLDPGHGGSDPGAVGYGLQEKTVNLDVSNRAYSLFVLEGATTYRTRSTDVFVSLSGRTTYANNNGVHRFISMHNNAFNGTARGTETFCHTSLGTSADLRNKVNAEIVQHIGTINRGVKTATFYVLAYTNMPAILSESAFIDNYYDNLILANASKRQEIARAHLHGTQSHYGITPHDPTSDIIVDNKHSAFYASGTWATGSYGAPYNGDYRWRATQAISDRARWTPNVPASGSWKVYAWWTDGANRSASAPYQITHSGGTATVNVNQQANGGKWNLLGTWNFGTGTGYPTYLSCWTGSGYVVIADAIKWVKN